MRTVKLAVIPFLCVSFLLLSGCGSELEDMRRRNNAQQLRIDELLSDLEATKLQLEQYQRKLETAQGRGDVELETLKKQIAALEEDIAQKDLLIAEMQKRLLTGGTALPVELSTLLEDFAKANSNMVSYDSERGIVKFQSDLLFDVASDQVSSTAVAAVTSLCGILNTEQGREFDIIIAGHTDDIPIGKPETRAKHPTNWHLSVHRAISVEDVMEDNNIDPKRMSVRGFGEYRPIVDNLEGKKGNPQNRRVEIYIVPQGT